jgi:hypothetical protein
LALGQRGVQCQFGRLPEQRRVDPRRLAGTDFLQDVADALVGGGEAGRLGQGREGAHGRQPLRNVAEALRAQTEDSIDFQRRIALLAQAAGEAFVDEVRQAARHLGVGQLGRLEQPGEVERQVALDQHADHAQRMAAQGEGILVAGRQLADAEHVGQGLQLVGQRHAQADRPARQFVAGEARLVVILDGVGDLGGLAVVQRVIAAHDALQLGELADHVGQQVGLRQHRGAVGLVRQGLAAQLLADGAASAATRSTRSPWVPSLL